MEFTSPQARKLLKIPYAKGKGLHTVKLTALALAWGRSYGTTWQKWYALHKAEGNVPSTTPVSVAAPATKVSKKGVIPMSFTGVDFNGGRSKVMPTEEASMRKGLDLAIKNELASPKRGILFPTRYINRAKKYFAERYPKNVFSFHTTGNKKDKTNSILVKRM